MERVLVTGATGFVGRHLCNLLASNDYKVIGATRSPSSSPASSGVELVTIGDIGNDVDWGAVLERVDGVVHLAARVHVMRENAVDPLAEFRRINVSGTERLLHQAGKHGVKRFVYVSSIKVNGDATSGSPFKITDKPSPSDPYGQSKLEAENIVEGTGAKLGVETAIVRPPLVYGPGVGGNLIRLMQIVEKGIPLPFGMVHNSRSLVGVDNLCSLIFECLTNQSAAGKRLLVSDNKDVSTKELVQLIAMSMSKRPKFLPIPAPIIRLAAKLIGRSAEASRLLGSLQVDMSDTLEMLDWTPPMSLEEGIQSTVRWYQKSTQLD